MASLLLLRNRQEARYAYLPLTRHLVGDQQLMDIAVIVVSVLRANMSSAISATPVQAFDYKGYR